MRGLFKPKQIGNILYKTIEEKYFSQVKDITGKAFAINEPLCSSFGITENDFHVFLDSYKKILYHNPLSVIAIDEKKDEVAGVAISDDYFEELPEEIGKKIPKSLGYVLEYLEEVKSQLLQKGLVKKQKGEYCHIFLLAANDKYKGQGIAKNICLMNYQVAASLGYKYAFAEATAIGSQQILGKQGFKTVQQDSYKDLQKRLNIPNMSQVIKNFGSLDEAYIKFMLKELNLAQKPN